MRPTPLLRPHALVTARASVSSTRRRTIYIADPHPIVSKGVAAVVQSQPVWHACGMAGSYARALDEIEALKPDLLIVEVDLEGQSGLELVRSVRERGPKPVALVFSMHDERIYAPRALRVGASGYLMKGESTAKLLEAIRQVLDGGVYLSPEAQNSALHAAAQARPQRPLQGLASLTDRELDVLRLLGQGKRTHEIAQLLSLSVKTVGSHRANMMSKLCLSGSSQLVQHAIELRRTEAGEERTFALNRGLAPRRGLDAALVFSAPSGLGVPLHSDPAWSF